MQPLLPAVIAFASGLAFSRYFNVSPAVASALALLSAVLPVMLYIRRFRFFALAVAPLFFFLGSLFMTPYVNPTPSPDHMLNIIRQNPEAGNFFGNTIDGVIASEPEYAFDSTIFNIEAKRVLLKGGAWRATRGLVLVTAQGRLKGIGYGDIVRLTARLKEPYNLGNPGEPDMKARLNMQGVFVTAHVRDPRFIARLGDSGASFAGYVSGLRRSVSGFIDAKGAENREVIKAFITGERRGIDKGLNAAYNRTGTGHILSISGLHVGIVMLFTYRLVLLVLKSSERLMLAINIKRLAALLTVPPVFAYGLFSGLQVSALRSVIMAACFVFAFLVNRGKDHLNTLLLAAFAILAATPPSLWDVSFQLSFLAVFFIIYLGPVMSGVFAGEGTDAGDAGDVKKGFFRRIFYKYARPSFFVTLAASLGTIPVVAYHFHRASLIGIIANIIAVPITSIAVPLVFLATITSFFWRGLAGMLLYAADLAIRVLNGVVYFFSMLPYSSVWVSTPDILSVFAFLGAVICAAKFKRRAVYRYLTLAFIAVIIFNWAYPQYERKTSTRLSATFLSVGQGDSALIEFPGGKTMLIDGGGVYSSGYDTGERVIAPFLWSRKIKDIDYIVLSHPQLDHMQGLIFVIENFNVGEFWWSGYGGALPEVLKIALNRRKVAVRVMDKGYEKTDINNVSVEAIGPTGDEQKGLDANNASLVVRLLYGKRSLLFTGDIGEEGERLAIKRDISSDVLKAPHHGSRNSSSLEFLDVVRPSVVVVSAGRDNVFGFPHSETLARYGAINAEVLRTDLNGAIAITTDGEDLQKESYLTESYN
ncbi:MAG: DNA internalization-related competence protein ComEC/Rec2 [Deltaproteobacteria bacterium]